MSGNEQEMLAGLQKSWPETADYLQRSGQVTNDQMIVRETLERDEYETSLTWLDELGYDVEDLLQRPLAVSVLQRLHSSQILVPTAAQLVPEYKAALQEHEDWQLEEHEEVREHPLEDHQFKYWIPPAADEELWQVPELQEKLILWGQQVAARHGTMTAPTPAQAMIVFRVVQFLDQEPDSSPEWAAECLRSALSSDFYNTAGNPPK